MQVRNFISVFHLYRRHPYTWERSNEVLLLHYTYRLICGLANGEVWAWQTYYFDSRRDSHMVAPDNNTTCGGTTAGTTWHSDQPRNWHIRSRTPLRHLRQRKRVQWVWCFLNRCNDYYYYYYCYYHYYYCVWYDEMWISCYSLSYVIVKWIYFGFELLVGPETSDLSMTLWWAYTKQLIDYLRK